MKTQECPPLEKWSEGIVGMQQERAYILTRNSVEAWEPCRLCPGPRLAFGNESHSQSTSHPSSSTNISLKAFLALLSPCQKYSTLGKSSLLVEPVLTPSLSSRKPSKWFLCSVFHFPTPLPLLEEGLILELLTGSGCHDFSSLQIKRTMTYNF